MAVSAGSQEPAVIDRAPSGSLADSNDRSFHGLVRETNRPVASSSPSVYWDARATGGTKDEKAPAEAGAFSRKVTEERHSTRRCRCQARTAKRKRAPKGPFPWFFTYGAGRTSGFAGATILKTFDDNVQNCGRWCLERITERGRMAVDVGKQNGVSHSLICDDRLGPVACPAGSRGRTGDYIIVVLYRCF